MKTLTMLKRALAPEGIAVQYKGHAAAAEHFSSPAGKWYEVTVWQPVTAKGTFSDLPLENITEWKHERFCTEGEALMAAFQFIDTL